VLAGEGHVLLGPQAPHQLEELAGPRVPLGLVALGVAVRGEVVLARHDVDQQASAGQLVERPGRRGEVRRLPVARPDRDQRLEGRRPGGQRGRDREGVRPAPPGAEERAGPAVVLGEPGQLGQAVEAVVSLDGVVPAVTGIDLVRDVPEESHGNQLMFT
jgi:hypothetical protein